MNSEMARIFVSIDPRSVAEGLLTYVVKILNANGGAVLQWEDPRLQTFVSVAIDVGHLGRARVEWDRGLEVLRSGKVVPCAQACLIPLLFDGALVGAVLLDGVTTGDLGEVALPLATALALPPMARRGFDAALEKMSPDELEKEQTLVLLNANEWNVARVARLMSCTRRTVYQRLERWGIPRQRVWKDPRRRRKLAPA